MGKKPVTIKLSIGHKTCFVQQRLPRLRFRFPETRHPCFLKHACCENGLAANVFARARRAEAIRTRMNWDGLLCTPQAYFATTISSHATDDCLPGSDSRLMSKKGRNSKVTMAQYL